VDPDPGMQNAPQIDREIWIGFPIQVGTYLPSVPMSYFGTTKAGFMFSKGKIVSCWILGRISGSAADLCRADKSLFKFQAHTFSHFFVKKYIK
jgi:hypothetical protein